MATSSFTKNFSVSKIQSKNFLNRMNKTEPLTLSRRFESKHAHLEAHSEKLRKVFGQ